MKVVLVSLMLLLAFIAIDCSPLVEEEKAGVPDDVDEEILRDYLNWKEEQPQDGDKSFKYYLDSTATKIEERNLSDNGLALEERARGRSCFKICLPFVACYRRCRSF